MFVKGPRQIIVKSSLYFLDALIIKSSAFILENLPLIIESVKTAYPNPSLPCAYSAVSWLHLFSFLPLYIFILVPKNSWIIFMFFSDLEAGILPLAKVNAITSNLFFIPSIIAIASSTPGSVSIIYFISFISYNIIILFIMNFSNI